MNIFVRKFLILLSFIVVVIIVYQKKNQYRNDLSLPLAELHLYYRIGTIDPRFHLTEDEAKILLQDAAKIWEQPLGHQFFFYNPKADFKVNFIYDQRQQRTNERQHVEREIADDDGRTQVASAHFEQQKSMLQDEVRQHNDELHLLNARISHHQQLVALVNSHGGTTQSEAQIYQDENDQINRDVAKYNQNTVLLNAKEVDLQNQAKAIQSQVDAYNEQYQTYSKKFSGRLFEVGLYNGDEINIYEYGNKDDLRLILAHEIGHSLGLNHSHDPLSLMYPILEKQDQIHFKLTKSDIDLLYGRAKSY